MKDRRLDPKQKRAHREVIDERREPIEDLLARLEATRAYPCVAGDEVFLIIPIGWGPSRDLARSVFDRQDEILERLLRDRSDWDVACPRCGLHLAVMGAEDGWE